MRDATFSVGSGEVFGLLGPNGAGKTTLLRMLGTIITPTSGYCEVAGLRADDDAQGVRRRLGFLSGNTRLYGRLTPCELLRYFGRLYGMPDDTIERRINELLGLLQMESFAKRRCDTLSTGQLQRVSISRVLLHEPEVLILDEPTLGLDIMSSRTILDFIAAARDHGRSIIFSTHYMTEAELLCDRVGLMHQGRILAMGEKDALYAKTRTTNLKDAFLALVEDDGEGSDE
ncbi:MAG: ATP-binding cassette domain-containing protein [bacterium]|nr:ATP-binding cassette domain-containing protein [bacterium]